MFWDYAVPMSPYYYFSISVLVSFLGGMIAKRLKVAAPLQVGGIIAVAVFNVIFGTATSVQGVSFYMQVVSGALLGCGMKRDKMADLRRLLLPAATMVLGMICINFFMGNVVRLTSGGGMDYLTAFICCIPGGVTESVIIADQMGADVPIVALFQLVRTVFSLLAFPSLIISLSRKEEKDECVTKPEAKTVYDVKRVAITLIVATLGGVVGTFVPLPASVLVFSLLAVSVLNVQTGIASVPRPFKSVAQILTGVYVGSRVTEAYVFSMAELVFPLMVMMALYLVCNTVLGLFLAKVYHQDKTTMLFACTPAGASDIALIASDYLEGAAGASIALMHIIRLSSCIVLFPLCIRFFVFLLS